MLAGKLDSDIKHMAVLIFLKFLDFEQVSVDSERPILGQAPRVEPGASFLILPPSLSFKDGRGRKRVPLCFSVLGIRLANVT